MALIVLATTHVFAQVVSPVTEHWGMCDASAAVPADAQMFVVGNDEDNVLRVYWNDRGGSPVASLDVSDFLKVDPRDPEVDIEGAARTGNLIYWISSHARSRKGKFRESRHRFFATEISVEGREVTLRPFGVPYRSLVADLAALPGLSDCKIPDAAAKQPQVEGALNIEALCAKPDGNTLLIAFRNPIQGGKALLVPLQNPQDVIAGKAAPKFGEPIRLALGGLGFRGMAYHPERKTYLILAGPAGDTSNFRLYEWSGIPAEEPRWIEAVHFGDLQPEALLVYPQEKSRVQVLSDDGMKSVNGTPCKEADAKQRSFRSVWVTLK
jgi:hypothetical protein